MGRKQNHPWIFYVCNMNIGWYILGWWQNILGWWQNTYSMPSLMKIWCQAMIILSPVFLISVWLPIGHVTLYGHPVTGAVERTTLKFCATMLLLWLSVSVWGLAARKEWGRWFMVAAWLFSYLAVVVVTEVSGANIISTWPDLLSSVLACMIFYLCLFHLPSVKRYWGLGRAE